MRLADACTIQMGYTPRGRLEAVAEGGALAIQLRDISSEGRIDLERLSRLGFDGVSDRYLVRPGDVLFRSRGERNTASVVDERLSEPAVAVLPLIVLRPLREVVEPAFLAWVINQAPAQRHFDSAARGSNLRMIPRTSLDTLNIDVPDLATQRLIVAVNELAERERLLTVLWTEKRKQLMSLMLLEQAKKNQAPIKNMRKK